MDIDQIVTLQDNLNTVQFLKMKGKKNLWYHHLVLDNLMFPILVLILLLSKTHWLIFTSLLYLSEATIQGTGYNMLHIYSLFFPLSDSLLIQLPYIMLHKHLPFFPLSNSLSDPSSLQAWSSKHKYLTYSFLNACRKEIVVVYSSSSIYPAILK